MLDLIKNHKIAFFLTFLLISTLVGCPKKATETILVCAASSTEPALIEIASAAKKELGAAFKINAASSSTVAKQIEQGAKCDIYLSANSQWMSYLEKKSLIKKNSKKILLKNSLVFIKSKNQKAKNKFAIADPSHVPAGKYAKEALVNLGRYKELEKILLLGKSARDTLRLIELGEANLGVVYKSDALSSSKVSIDKEIAQKYYSKIAYPIAIVKKSKKKSSEKVLNFLFTKEASEIFKKWGFLTL